MRDEDKSREELLAELKQLRLRLAELDEQWEERRLLTTGSSHSFSKHHSRDSARRLAITYDYEIKVALSNVKLFASFLIVAPEEKRPEVAERLKRTVSWLQMLVDNFTRMEWLDGTSEE